MFKILWKSVLVTPAILGATLAISSVANAAESAAKAEILETETTGFEVAQLQEDATLALEDNATLDQIEQYSNEGQSNIQGQVTNVGELRDVEPTAWAYEALRSLVERYGCIVGYPDRTFRGNRSLSRWEFAAGLNACLNVMERLIQENVAVLREDIDKLKRLMEEFQAELAALGARVDNLESRVAFLEDHQFSTTTKLAGEVIFATSGSYINNDAGNQQVFQDRVRLVLNTSFSGEDRLVTRLAAGNAELFKQRANVGGVGFQSFTEAEFMAETGLTFDDLGLPAGTDTLTLREEGSLTADFQNPLTNQTWQNTRNDNNVEVDWLAYYFPWEINENFKMQTYVAATGGLWDDFTPTLNPYFEDYDGGNGSLSSFAQRNPIYRIGGGAGAGVSFQLGWLESLLGPSSLTLGYLSGTASSPDESFGLFNGNYGALAQINFNLGNSFNFGFTYVNAYHRPDSAIFASGAVGDFFDPTSPGTAGLVGTSTANLSNPSLNSEVAISTLNIERVRADAFDGGVNVAGATVGPFSIPGSDFTPLFDLPGKQTNSYGVEATWRVADWMNISAFGSYTNVRLIGFDTGDIWTYGAGFAFPDVWKEGNLLGIFAGVQPYLAGVALPTTATDSNGDRINILPGNKNPIHVELFYKYQVTDNISITPGLIWLSNPGQFEADDSLIGTVRGTFTF